MRKTTPLLPALLAAMLLSACGGGDGDAPARSSSSASSSSAAPAADAEVTSAQFIDACTNYYANAPTGTLTSAGTRVPNSLRETIVERGPRNFCACIDSQLEPTLAKAAASLNRMVDDQDINEARVNPTVVKKARRDALEYYPELLASDLDPDNRSFSMKGMMLGPATDACEAPFIEELYD